MRSGRIAAEFKRENISENRLSAELVGATTASQKAVAGERI
jgi:hypothetical protein